MTEAVDLERIAGQLQALIEETVGLNEHLIRAYAVTSQCGGLKASRKGART